METYEGDVELFTKDRKGDERLAVRFFRKAVKDEPKTLAEGRGVFVEVEHIQIMVPGDRDNVIVRPAGEGDKRRFAEQYRDWRENDRAEQVVGTPLEMWGRLSLSQVEELRYIGCRTVEQLAALNDAACFRMPGAMDLKQKAQAFVAAQTEEAPLRRLQAELESRDAKLADQDERIAAQDQAMTAMRSQIERLLTAKESAPA